jgi:hypothetical protein
VVLVRSFSFQNFEKSLKKTTKSMTRIFALCGGMGCGKSYLTREIMFPKLSKMKPTIILSFADHFKITLCAQRKNDVTFEKVFHKKDEMSRTLLQQSGEEGRKQFGKDIWIRHMAMWIRLFSENGIKQFIIPDVRLPEELEWLESLGKDMVCIYIRAPKRVKEKALQEANNDEKVAARLLSDKTETQFSNKTDIELAKIFSFILENDPEDQETVQTILESFIDQELEEERV